MDVGQADCQRQYSGAACARITGYPEAIGQFVAELVAVPDSFLVTKVCFSSWWNVARLAERVQRLWSEERHIIISNPLSLTA